MFGVSALRRRRYVLVGAALVTYILYLEFPRGLIGLLPSQLQPQQFVETSPLQLPHLLPRDGTIQRTNLRVAVLEHAGFHDGESHHLPTTILPMPWGLSCRYHVRADLDDCH